MLTLAIVGVLSVYPLVLIVAALLFVRKERRRYARHHRAYQAPLADADGCKVITVGIFHPYAHGGGGGERVLYCALLALTKRYEQLRGQHKNIRLQLVLYAGDDGLSATQLLEDAAARFHLPGVLKCHISLVKLPNRDLLEPSNYPRFTLLWQSIAHVRVARVAFQEGEKMGFFPQVWLDTTGCAFSYLLASLRYGCKVVAYVHYPMISTDMIDKVQARSSDFNNDSAISSSVWKSRAKFVYYKMFAIIYGLVGYYCTDVVMVNSTWTYNHIRSLWHKVPTIVYPPCGDMKNLTSLPIDKRQCVALSIAQFRPEKNHLLQLQALKLLLEQHETMMATRFANFKLVLLGSCRNDDDHARVNALKEQCLELGIPDERVQFVVNASFDVLMDHLSTASIGVHTMYNEHFGISVVEMMASGLIVIANNSGGPAADIVKSEAGMLAVTSEEYAVKLRSALEMEHTAQSEMRMNARSSSRRFSDEEFIDQFLAAMDSLLEV